MMLTQLVKYTLCVQTSRNCNFVARVPSGSVYTLTTDYSYRRLCDLNLGPATLCAGADREQQTILLSELHFL